MKFPIALAAAACLSSTVWAQDLGAGVEALRDAVDTPGFSGAVVLMQDGEILFEAYRGFADQETGREVSEATRFNIASAGKFLTAMTYISAARDAGLDPATVQPADWFDDQPGLFDPELTAPALLAHATTAQSFMQGDGNAVQAMAAARSNHDVFGFTAEAQAAPVTRLGDRLAYSNSGFILLGELIERIDGHAYEEAVRARVLRQADVEARFTRIANAEADGLALPYVPEGFDPEAPPSPRVLENLPAAYPARAESPLGEMISSAAGGLFISARDFAQIGDAALAGRIISTSDLEWMCTSLIPASVIFGRGCGGRDFGPQGVRWGHNGGAPGVSAEFALYPRSGLTLVVLSNHDRRAAPVLTAFEAAYIGPAAESGGMIIRQ